MIKLNEITPIITTTIILFIAASIGATFSQTSAKSMYSLAFAILFYIILPGYFILLNIKLSNLERIMFPMPISITIMSITFYTIDIFGIKLGKTNIIITAITICTLAIILREKFCDKNNSKNNTLSS